MNIQSKWVFNCAPHHIWPHFLHARMDTSKPLLFRLGVPKPVSCKVLEGEGAVGNTRQCTTDRGTIDQTILDYQSNRRLRYRMIDSNVWCKNWIGYLEDEFVLVPPGENITILKRHSTFSTRGPFTFMKTLALWLALKQAHRYASRNWRRLGYASAHNKEA
ncbi:hypothetical protein G6L28_00985 [Agrobacterium larrymoorei]|nr:hypothetical protein [Agrobacterium larrymoorei]